MGNFYLVKYVLVFFAALTSLDNVIAVTADTEAEAVCKVNKAFVRLFATGQEGLVIIEGADGAISSTSPVSGYVKNMTTEQRVDFVPTVEMSFSVQINAKTGDKIRVYARNDESKRSYGTFVVTDNMSVKEVYFAGDSTETAIKEYPEQCIDVNDDGQGLAPSVESTTFFPKLEIEKTEVAESGTNMAVVIMIVNTDTGEVVSTTQVTGKAKAYADKSEKNFNIMIQRIINRCTNIIESEIFRPDLPRAESE